MGEVVALPASGAVFFDQRGRERALRISSHTEAGVVVLSLWRADRCTGTFRIPVDEVADLVAGLVDAVTSGSRSSVSSAPSPREGPAGTA